MNDATASFIAAHADDDVRRLAFKKVGDEVDLALALEQISGRQTALRKFPTWAATDGIIYPPHLNLEQSSSEQTAHYKATVCRSLNARESMVDLTGGLGVDFSFMAMAFKHAVYVERELRLCKLATHNFPLLGLNHIEVKNADSIGIIDTLEHASLLYLDPSRRDSRGKRTYALEDCTPDVVALQQRLLQKCDYLLLKLSPMFDWRETVKRLEYVREIHIVSVKNECKELLALLSKENNEPLRVVCVNDNDVFTFSPNATQPERKFGEPECNHYIYEPNSSIMKAGCFDEIAAQWDMRAVAPHSHLFFSEENITSFPGRKFQISAISSMNKRVLKTHFSDIQQANVSVRNFPMSAQELQRTLHLKDGGDTYVFGTTTHHRHHVLYICRKA